MSFARTADTDVPIDIISAIAARVGVCHTRREEGSTRVWSIRSAARARLPEAKVGQVFDVALPGLNHLLDRQPAGNVPG
jgi:hypothetical protein